MGLTKGLKELIFMLRKVFAALTAVCTMAAACTAVLADEYRNPDEYVQIYGNFIYEPDGYGAAKVTGYTDISAEEIIVPAEINGMTVTAAGGFNEMTNLKRVVIPDCVTAIFSSAFYGCTSLEEVVLPKNIDKIPSYCFYECESLKRIDIPDGVTFIGPYAFSESGLTEIVLPDGLEEIDRYAFSECEALEKVVIPDSAKELGGYIFDESDKVKIYCAAGSNARKYAKRYDIECVINPNSAKDSALTFGIIAGVWTAVIVAVVICVIAAKKRNKQE